MLKPVLRKKLIEVALPLDAINQASAREKSIRHGHPSTLHLWWARRPLAAARAVIFAQMVDDPSSWPEEFPTEAAQEAERQRLFRLIEQLVKWENTTNEDLLEQARNEIRRSWRRTCAEHQDHPQAAELFDPERLPAFHDPFAGGGSLPLEAQRLGLEAHASDLNPVAVLINKAMIEIPPKFAGMPPVNPEARAQMARDRELGMEREWKGAQGLAEDVRYYGKWMRDEAEKRIGHLYPKVEVTAEMAKERPDLERYVGRKLRVIAWLWARTVKSPNPAFRDVDVPLATTFVLSKKKGKEAYVEPVFEGRAYRFTVKVGVPEAGASESGASAGGVPGNAGIPPATNRRSGAESSPGPENVGGPPAQGTKLGRGANFRCLMSGMPVPGDYIKAEGQAKRMGARLMAVVAEGDRGRLYLSPTSAQEEAACKAKPEWRPEGDVPARLTGGTCVPYGLTAWGDLFTSRQLVALTTLSELVEEATERVQHGSVQTGGLQYDAGAYAKALGVFLAFALSKQADLGNSLCRWEPIAQCPRQLFGRQAIPMVWDFAEGNPVGHSSGAYEVFVNGIASAITKSFECLKGSPLGFARQADVGMQDISMHKLISTDPPYYDNICYADLSDFFYSWLRRSLRLVFPELFATLFVPKAEELVATSYRHGGKQEAELFFLKGMKKAIGRIAERAHPALPITIYYAFKQSEMMGHGIVASTGWETFLAALIEAGLSVTGTWPMRTENASRLTGMSSNALASSIVLVCRKRPEDAPLATRHQFIDALKAELPSALAHLQSGGIAPVDLAQAAIGPGMAIYTRYAKVVDATGEPVTVREALTLINQTLDECLSAQEGDFDADTRWALAWFEQHGFEDGDYGDAETLSKAKNTSIASLQAIGILQSKAGKVALLIPLALRQDWDPRSTGRVSVWLTLHHLIRVHDAGGEQAAAALVGNLGGVAETARELAYRLYAIAERTKRAREALWYNALVQSWPEIARLAREKRGEQASLLAPPSTA